MGLERRSRGKIALAALAVVLLIALGAVSYQYSLLSSKASGLSSSVSVATSELSIEASQLGTVQYQLSTAQSSISAVSSSEASLKGLIATDNSTISADVSQISSLNSEISSDTQSIAKLKAQNATANSEISALMANVTAYQNTVSSLESQQSSLQRQVAGLQAITNLNSTKVEVNDTTYLEPAGDYGQFRQFADGYAGYLLFVGTANSTNLYIGVNVVYSTIIDGQFGETASYLYGSNGIYALVVPITPGITTLSLGNYDTKGTDAVTMTVTYYY